MKRLDLVSPYNSVHMKLNDKGFCVLRDKDRNETYLSVEDMISRFEKLKNVEVYGIIKSEIVDLETGEVEHVSTKWDEIKRHRKELKKINIKIKIKSLEKELNEV